jgi:hypothetical protein
VLLYFYFLRPIYGESELKNVSLYSSTSQNIEFFSQSLGRLQSFFYEEKPNRGPQNVV